jgi:hypothetical protein
MTGWLVRMSAFMKPAPIKRCYSGIDARLSIRFNEEFLKFCRAVTEARVG